MSPHELPEPSHDDDSDILRKWVPVVVPLCAVVLSALAFMIGWEVLIRY